MWAKPELWKANLPKQLNKNQKNQKSHPWPGLGWSSARSGWTSSSSACLWRSPGRLLWSVQPPALRCSSAPGSSGRAAADLGPEQWAACSAECGSNLQEHYETPDHCRENVNTVNSINKAHCLVHILNTIVACLPYSFTDDLFKSETSI